MTDAADHSLNSRKHLEFTPIGYSRQNRLKRANGSPTQTLAEDGKSDDEGPLRKSRRTDIDDTMASHRMFNDSSQFDDTLPHLNEESNTAEKSDGVAKNLIENLKENASVSNPLKEQQEQLHKLNTDNYNLRLKCNSLLKFLHSVTDQGELTKSLGLLDEVHEWKQKYYVLNQQYLELKEKLIQLEANVAVAQEGKKETTEADHTSCQSEILHLQNQLEKNNLQLNTFRDEVGHLEGRLVNLQEEQASKDEQHRLEIQMLKSDVNNLNMTLISKERELDENRAKIQRLTNQLHEFDHKGSQSLLDLERQLDMKKDSIANLEKEVRSLTNDRVQLESQIKEKDAEVHKLKLEFERLHNDAEIHNHSLEVDELKQAKVSLSERVSRLIDERSKLNARISTLIKESDGLKSKHQTDQASNFDHKGELNTLKQELEATRIELEETRSAAQQLQTQVIENATKNSEKTSQRIRDKEYQIQKLETEVQAWKQQVKEGSTRLQAEEQRNRGVFESELKNLKLRSEFEKSNLEREIALLKEEKLALQDTYEREHKLWETKCDTLNKENDRLVRQEIGDLDGIKRKLSQQVEKLQEKLNSTEGERSELAENLIKLQHSKDAYKEELKRVSSKLEFLSKEYLKTKQTTSTDDDEQKSKYNTMKQRLLAELKGLQEENLSLEKRLLEQKGSSRSRESASRSDTSTQDRLDYYRLKYNSEVKHNNDLRIMNDYLNRVLRASSQHLRLDLLKLESEVQQGTVPPKSYRTYPDEAKYTYPRRPGLISPGRAPSFKAVALLVLACIRMKQTAINYRWDEQRIRYLRRKMAVDEDRISW